VGKEIKHRVHEILCPRRFKVKMDKLQDFVLTNWESGEETILNMDVSFPAHNKMRLLT